MTKQERHEKMNEGVAQIGRLIGVCAQHGLSESDITVMVQTSTSLLCEMNDIDIASYMRLLYVLHKRREDNNYDSSCVDAELSAIFALKETQH